MGGLALIREDGCETDGCETIEFICLNIMIVPKNIIYLGSLPDAKSPIGYGFWASVHDGPERRDRYWLWNGRVPFLAPRDVLREKYCASHLAGPRPEDPLKISPETEKHLRINEIYGNFLAVNDSENRLELR